MRLARLSLSNFRNFIRLETDIPDGPTLLVGSNAQGKTSLLEAIYYLTAAQSPHASNDRQLINFLALNHDLPVARLVAEVQRAERLQRIEIRLILDPSGPTQEGRLRKEILVNGLKRRVADLAGVFTAVMFLPQNMRVIEGSPSERRRLLNATLAQAEPAYGHTLIEYGKVISQRNALLKNMAGASRDLNQLTFWDQQLAELGAKIIRTRALAIVELEHLAIPIHTSLSRKQEVLRLQYLPSYNPVSSPKGQLGLGLDTPPDWTGIDTETIRQGLLETYENNRPDEIARGMTLTGPHRDDLSFRANGIDLRFYGSRGQNRTAMLALKMAEVEWLAIRTGETPVLLLDEVMAELDTERRSDLLTRIQSASQAILTAADLNMFDQDFCKKATIWEIEAGRVKPLGEGNLGIEIED